MKNNQDLKTHVENQYPLFCNPLFLQRTSLFSMKNKKKTQSMIKKSKIKKFHKRLCFSILSLDIKTTKKKKLKKTLHRKILSFPS